MATEGGITVPIPVPNFWPDVFGETKHAWEGRETVERVWRALGCSALAIAAAWAAGGDSRQELKDVAHGVLGLNISRDRRAQDRTRAYQWLKTDKRAADRWFRANPDQYALALRIVDEGYRPPCPITPVYGEEGPKGRLRKFWKREQRELGREAEAQREAEARRPATQPRPGTQRPPGPLSQRSLDDYLKLIDTLRAWWLQREQLRQQERESKRFARFQRLQTEAQIEALLAAQGGTQVGLSDFVQGLGDVVTAIAPAVTSIYSTQAQIDLAKAQARGGSNLNALLQQLGGTPGYNPTMGNMDLPLVPGIDDLIARLGEGSGDVPMVASNSTLYRQTANGSVVPKRDILAVNPRTGSLQAWQYAGKPILFSRDVNTCRRVRKVARAAASGVGLRFRTSGTRRRRR